MIKSSSFSVIPQSLSEIFLLNLNLLFPSQQSFSRARDIFSVCLATLRPLTLREIYECLLALIHENDNEVTQAYEWEDFLHSYSVIAHFLPMKDDETVHFFHSSFKEWLAGKRSFESNKFVCDARTGHSAIALHLARRSLGKLGDKETLDLAHHILKAQLFKAFLPVRCRHTSSI